MSAPALIPESRTFEARVRAMQETGMSMKAIIRALGLTQRDAVACGLVERRVDALDQPKLIGKPALPNGVQLCGSMQTVWNILLDAAQNGAPCPSGVEMAGLVGFSGTATVTRHMAKLEKLGLIRIESHKAARRVTIVETGEQTGWTCRGRHAGR